MSAKAEFEQLVAEKMERGMPRDKAAVAVMKADPELRQRMVDEANEDRPRAA